MPKKFFFPADAHEGPVWVREQYRLYYSTKTHLDGRQRVDIEYLDFGKYGMSGKPDWWKSLPGTLAADIKPQVWIYDAGMANSSCLSSDRRQLLVCEQGDKKRPSVLARYNLADNSRSVVIDGFAGKAFNSLNKVLVSKRGHILLSDPDYGFRQNFKPPPELEPMIYVRPAGSDQLSPFRCQLEMPHGLALSPDETTLFVSDTSDDGAHDDDVELGRQKSVWKYRFDPATGEISGPGECCFQVAEGVPDGMATTGNTLLVGGGDGVYVADLNGTLTGKIPIANRAVNVALAGDGRHLFVTNDEGVVLCTHWREHVESV